MATIKYRPFACTVCGHVQQIQTNHEGECYEHCKECSWKPSIGPYVRMFGAVYRLFRFDAKTAQADAVIEQILSEDTTP